MADLLTSRAFDLTPVVARNASSGWDRPSPISGKLASVAFLSTMPPQRCGLATFTADLMRAIQQNDRDLTCEPVSVTDRDEITAATTASVIEKHDPAAYRRVGLGLQAAGTDVLCVQHEYGIFGGPDGEMLLDLLESTDVPVVATLHTVLDNPSRNQRRVMNVLLARAKRVVVMTERSGDIVRRVHCLNPERLHVVPHGIPAVPVRDRASCRQMLGLPERPTLLTFGLLSPGKGIEHAIRALPALRRSWPDLIYLVVGATHPNLLRERGEEYRDSLTDLAEQLGVADNVRFVNRFVDLPELVDMMTAADVYLTPYNNVAQSVSGTMSYSYGFGLPVVSTPYHHAAELLANGRGVLVPFADPTAIAAAVDGLLCDPNRMAAMRDAAMRDAHRMLWPNVGAHYLRILEEAAAARVVPALA